MLVERCQQSFSVLCRFVLYLGPGVGEVGERDGVGQLATVRRQKLFDLCPLVGYPVE